MKNKFKFNNVQFCMFAFKIKYIVFCLFPMGRVRKLKNENVNSNDVVQESMYNFLKTIRVERERVEVREKSFPLFCN